MSYYYTDDPVPEGWVLVQGHMLSVAARAAKIPTFRLAYMGRMKGRGTQNIPSGILIRAEDQAALQDALDKREARKQREKNFPSKNRHG